MPAVIRRAAPRELARLHDVERDGDVRHARYDGLPPDFDDVVPLATRARARGEGRLFVAADTSVGHEVLGFAPVEVVDGQAHLARLSARLCAQGEGIGRRLVDTVTAWAVTHAMTGVTLCTFADVAWNRPLYEHLGFVVLPPSRWTPGPRAVFVADARRGLDLGRRGVMRLDIG